MSNAAKVTVTFKREEVDEDSPDLSYLEQSYDSDVLNLEERDMYRKRDAERIAAYFRGDWRVIGIRAVAIIWVDHGSYKTQYTMESAGLWGIESDNGEDYLNDVYMDQCLELRADIEAMKQAEFKS